MTRLRISGAKTVEKCYAIQHFLFMLLGIRDTMRKTTQSIAGAVEKLKEKQRRMEERFMRDDHGAR